MKAKFLLRLKKTLKAKLERLAKKNKRSLNNYLEVVLDDHIKLETGKQTK